MKLEQDKLTVKTNGRGTTDITASVAEMVSVSGIQTGLCHLFLQHTSASLIICENYDPQVREDLDNFLNRLIPDGDSLFQHTAEGKDDMPAHIRTILTQTSVTIPIQASQLALGTWQGIYLYEHRCQAHTRHVVMSFLGNAK